MAVRATTPGALRTRGSAVGGEASLGASSEATPAALAARGGGGHAPMLQPPMARGGGELGSAQLAGVTGSSASEPRGSQLLPLRVCGALIGPPTWQEGGEALAWETALYHPRAVAVAAAVDRGEDWTGDEYGLGATLAAELQAAAAALHVPLHPPHAGAGRGAAGGPPPACCADGGAACGGGDGGGAEGAAAAPLPYSPPRAALDRAVRDASMPPREDSLRSRLSSCSSILYSAGITHIVASCCTDSS